MAGRAEGGAGSGERGDLDGAGAGLMERAHGTGECAAGGGDVVDDEDPAAGQTATPAGRRAAGDRGTPAAGATLVIGVAARAAEVTPRRGSEQADQRHVEDGGDARGGLVGVVPRQSASRAGRDPGDQVGADAR